MNAQKEWSITEQMLVGDFNPYHDPGTGRFTTGSGGSATGVSGEIESGSGDPEHKDVQWVNMYGHLNPAAYVAAAKELGCSVGTASKLLHSTIDFLNNPDGLRTVYNGGKNSLGDKFQSGMTDKRARRSVQGLETFIEKSPKWKSGPIYCMFNGNSDAVVGLAQQGKKIDLGGPTLWTSNKAEIDGRSGVVVVARSTAQKATSVKHLSRFKSDAVVSSGKASFKPSGEIEQNGSLTYVYGDLD